MLEFETSVQASFQDLLRFRLPFQDFLVRIVCCRLGVWGLRLLGFRLLWGLGVSNVVSGFGASGLGGSCGGGSFLAL